MRYSPASSLEVRTAPKPRQEAHLRALRGDVIIDKLGRYFPNPTRPCPKCGDRDARTVHSMPEDQYHGWCAACGFTTKRLPTNAHAISAWDNA
jgi:hypothetical protein